MAGLIVLTEEEWAAVGPFLGRLSEFGGKALVVPPGPARVLEAAKTRDPAGELLWYDFGGEADYMVDVVEDLGELSAAEIRQQYEDGDLGMVQEQAARAYGIWPAGLEEDL
jgi:hypothetical protein